MKLKQLTVSNFQILSDIVIDFARKPIVLLAAANEQGKSSVIDALYAAFTGQSTRVPLKKDYAQLVHDGAKKGQISLEWEGGKSRLMLPSGSFISDGNNPKAMEFVLLANRFARLDADARRRFLFDLLNARIGPDELARRLKDKQHDAKLIASCNVSKGAAEAYRIARQNATEARGAWKAVTGEAYGEVKAETWAPPVVEFDAAVLEQARQDLSDLDQSIEELSRNDAARKQAITDRDTQARHIEKLRETAARHERAKRKLESDESDLNAAAIQLEAARAASRETARREAPAELAEMAQFIREMLALTKSTGLTSLVTAEPLAWDAEWLKRLEAAAKKYEAVYGDGAQPDPQKLELAGKVSERQEAYNMMKNTVANDQRDLALIELAIKELAELPADGSSELPADVEDDLRQAKARRILLAGEVAKHEALAQAAASREQRISDAATHHATALAWEALATDLAPDGIPSAMLKDALRPFNDRLRDTAQMTRWAQVRVDSDMRITMDGRDYALGSESARWKADTALAEAIAALSGTKVLVIDRMDVLDMTGRADFMEWIDTRVADGELDTVLICATLKELPTGFPDNWSLFWLESGLIYSEVEKRAA